MKMNLKKYMRILLMIFMILQPTFDIFYLYSDEIINIFKFSPATIIRMIIMCILFITSLFMYRCNNKKKLKYLGIFAVIYGCYIIGHHINASNFSVLYGNFDKYSILNELFYMIRMIMPLLMVFVTYEKKLEWQDVKKVIISVVLFFSGVMVLANLFEVAITSYNNGTGIIKANFFDWFTEGIYQKYGYEFIASKGIFHMANQVSGTLICLFPIVIYIYLEEKIKVRNILTLMLMMLSMLMLGTRIASYGWIMVLLAMVIMYVFFGKVIKNLDFSWKKLGVLGIIFVIFLRILPFSPVSNRVYINDDADAVEENISVDFGEDALTKFSKEIRELEANAETEEDYQYIYELKIDFIKNNLDSYGFDRIYITKLYPYTEDYDFWLELFEVPFAERANHRQLKTLVTERIIELNDNKLDYVFGVSFTRLRNAQVYMENDIHVHLYSIGIIGILLFIVPYLVMVIYSFIKMLKNKNKFNYLNMTYLLSIVLIFVAGILSGNIFDEWIATLFLAFICGNLLVNIINDKK